MCSEKFGREQKSEGISGALDHDKWKEKHMNGIMEAALEVKNLRKKFKNFELNIEDLEIPKGFATALIGENGAGKTTLLSCLSGVRLDYQGEIRYFGRYVNDEREKPENQVRESIGCVGTSGYFLSHWTATQVADMGELLYEHFHKEYFWELCRDLNILPGGKRGTKISALSDGNRMKLMLASVFARDTKLLLLDEPTSPLDPLMREKLCCMLQEYLEAGHGDNTVLFSTHNISDMEAVTDYCIIIKQGRVVERGFVEDLKEKYVLVKGEKEDLEAARHALFQVSESNYGFEGICLAKDMEKLAGLRVSMEIPSLFQISVAVLKQYTAIV